MKQRTITAIIMLIVLIPFFLIGGWAFNGLAAVLAYFGTYELINMHQKQNKQLPNICKFTLPVFSVLLVLISGLQEINDIIYVFFLEVIFLLIMPIFNKSIKMTDIMFFIFAIIYSGLSFVIISFIRNLTSTTYSVVLFNKIDIYGLGLICVSFILVTTMLTDVFAYIFGIKFGKHKLCPTISPKKSVEGAIAGTVFGSLIGTVILVLLVKWLGSFPESNSYTPFYHFGLDYIVVFVIAIVISIAGQLGDLVASKIKREYGIKDYGNLFPGHGGVLDRFDSSIFSCLVFFVILMILGVI